MIVDFFVAGNPKPEPRTRKGRGGHFYRPKDDGWRSKVAWMAKCHAPSKPIAGPVTLTLHFSMPPPKGDEPRDYVLNAVPHTRKPDISNLVKNVEDALTTAKFWLDDSQVCRLETSKHYWGNPGVHITIMEM